ncbi:MAG: hypothetical protein ACXABY_13205 [Candidatus Thorarchaeota archaeon]|jgi:rubrerythrin
MSERKDPVRHMLNLALATAMNDLDYYQRALGKTKMPEVRALLMVLEESEEDLIERIEHMMVAGVLEGVEDSKDRKANWEPPNEDLFEFASPFAASVQFQKWSICNETLQRSLKAYGFYLSIATRAKSEVVSALFEYLAYLKSQHIKRLRKVCDSYDTTDQTGFSPISDRVE